MKKLPGDVRSRLEVLMILHETEIKIDELFDKVQPSIMRWTLEEREVRKLKLNIKVRITKYGDFKYSVDEYVRSLRTNGEAHS